MRITNSEQPTFWHYYDCIVNLRRWTTIVSYGHRVDTTPSASRHAAPSTGRPSIIWFTLMWGISTPATAASSNGGWMDFKGCNNVCDPGQRLYTIQPANRRWCYSVNVKSCVYYAVKSSNRHIVKLPYPNVIWCSGYAVCLSCQHMVFRLNKIHSLVKWKVSVRECSNPGHNLFQVCNIHT